MNAKIIRYNIDTGKTINEVNEQVIVTLGEYPDEMPIVSINVDSSANMKKNENLNIQLNIKELQEEISLDKCLKWIKRNK